MPLFCACLKKEINANAAREYCFSFSTATLRRKRLLRRAVSGRSPTNRSRFNGRQGDRGQPVGSGRLPARRVEGARLSHRAGHAIIRRQGESQNDKGTACQKPRIRLPDCRSINPQPGSANPQSAGIRVANRRIPCCDNSRGWFRLVGAGRPGNALYRCFRAPLLTALSSCTSVLFRAAWTVLLDLRSMACTENTGTPACRSGGSRSDSLSGRTGCGVCRARTLQIEHGHLNST